MSETGYRDKTEALAHENAALRRENEELRARIAGAQPIAAHAPRSTRTAVFTVAGMLILGGFAGLYFARATPVEPRVGAVRPLIAQHDEVGRLSVLIRADGTMLLDGDAMNNVQFSTRVRVLAGVQPNLRVVINADRDVPYARVIEVMDDVRTAGFQRVALATTGAR
ncbi:MAG: biopolymer transporter ExbD [Polyangiales bacterium]